MNAFPAVRKAKNKNVATSGVHVSGAPGSGACNGHRPRLRNEDSTEVDIEESWANFASRMSATDVVPPGDPSRPLDYRHISAEAKVDKKMHFSGEFSKWTRADAGCSDERGYARGDGIVGIQHFQWEDNPLLAESTRQRGCLLNVHGFAIQLNPQTMTTSVALVAEWPGIGSLHDFLSGRISGMPTAFQRDIFRWTRQAAEALVNICRKSTSRRTSDEDLGVVHVPRLSARNAFLFPRQKEGVRAEGNDVLDVRVRKSPLP